MGPMARYRETAARPGNTPCDVLHGPGRSFGFAAAGPDYPLRVQPQPLRFLHSCWYIPACRSDPLILTMRKLVNGRFPQGSGIGLSIKTGVTEPVTRICCFLLD
jgi:hypothetical protein